MEPTQQVITSHIVCVGCWQIDDHPKLELRTGPKHYDCLTDEDLQDAPAAVLRLRQERASGRRGPALAEVVEADPGMEAVHMPRGAYGRCECGHPDTCPALAAGSVLVHDV